MKNKNKVVKKILISVLVLLVLILTLYYIYKRLGLSDIDSDEIKEYLQHQGPLAPLLFILITFLQVTFIPIPSTITVLVGNYLFGFWLSYLYSFIGMILGSMFAFYLGRLFGRKFLVWLINDKELVDKYLYKIKKKGNVLLFLMFLFPFFPDDFLCSVAGVMDISTLSFFWMQIFCRGVTILATLFMLSGEVIPFTGWGIPFNITLTILLVTIFYICYKNAEVISDYFTKICRKIFKKKD